MTDEKYYSPDEIARKLSVSGGTVREWLRTGQLQGVKLGRLWRIRESELRRFLKENGQ